MRSDFDADVLFIEPFGGWAGDMFLAALLDLGDPRFTLADLHALAARTIPGECTLSLTETKRGSLRAAHLDVRTAEQRGGEVPHRHLADLLELLPAAELGPRAAERAAGVLRRIAAAEAAVHGVSVEEVHLHEVGAVDTLIDTLGPALALERLGIRHVFSAPPLVGSGTVRCAHGEMPVPAPGTAAILGDLPHLYGGEGERLTPTGAALYAGLVDTYGAPADLRVRATGYGAGTREPRTGPPNLMRVRLGSSDAGASDARTTVWLLEFNLDDATGEEVGFCLQALRGAGALEAWTAAVQMKKDRPGVVVSALVSADRRAELERVAFDHTATLGVRWSSRERTECAREELTVALAGDTVRVKLRRRPHAPHDVRPADLSPEYEDLARLARHSGRALRDLEREAVTAALAQL